MSYYTSTPSYYQNPRPYTSSDIGEPVPGWGVDPRVAGPRMVGVGQDAPAEGITVGRALAFGGLLASLYVVYELLRDRQPFPQLRGM